MKNFKKMLIIFLALAMSCSMFLTSCREKSNEDSSSENENADSNGNLNKDENGENGGDITTVVYEKPIVILYEGDTAIHQSILDKSGNVLCERFLLLSYGECVTQKYEYDNAGKVKKIIRQDDLLEPAYAIDFILGEDGISYSCAGKIEYHENGKIKSVMLDIGGFGFDQNGRRTTYFLNELGFDRFEFNYEGDSEVAKSYTVKERGVEDVTIDLVYNADGYVTSFIANTDGVFSTSYTYDKNGNPTSEDLCIKYEEYYEVYRSSVCEYDSNNNIIKNTITQFADQDKNEAVRKNVMQMQYDSKNLLTELNIAEYEGEENTDNVTNLLEYNVNGQIIKTTSIYEDKKCIMLYEYNAKGQMIKEIEENYNSDNELDGRKICEYEYDSLGRTIKIMAKSYDESDQNRSDITEYVYNEKCKITKMISTEYGENIDSPSTLKIIEDYEYDTELRIIKNTQTYYLGGKISSKTVVESHYDENGNSSVEITYYDENGNITHTESYG